MIADIDIWRAAEPDAQALGENAHRESAACADELAGESDHHGAAIWRLITDAVAQLANTPTGPVH